MTSKIPFTKPYTNSSDLITLLQQRGMTIEEPLKAARYLETIGYYRLSAYMYPLLQMPKSEHLYKQGASFNKVMMLYRFDKKLRLLIFNEIEKIEVAVRSAIVNIGSRVIGNPFWMTDKSNFINPEKFQHTMDLIDAELQRSREDFILHFKSTYSDPYPPAWMLSEILPYGVMTKIYGNIKVGQVKKQVARQFGLQPVPFESWLTIIGLTRNACCHHARVWNKQNTIRAMIPHHVSNPWITQNIDILRVYFNLCIIKYLLNTISPNNDMKAKIQALFTKFPEIDHAALGFPEGWENEPVWC